VTFERDVGDWKHLLSSLGVCKIVSCKLKSIIRLKLEVRSTGPDVCPSREGSGGGGEGVGGGIMDPLFNLYG